MREHPVAVGKLCGFDLLREDLHNDWIKQMISGHEDMTLLAHRGSYKTTCLSIALAIIISTDPKRNLIFLRKSEDAVKEIIQQVQKIILSEPFRYLTERAYGEDYGPVIMRQASSTSITTHVYAASKGAVGQLTKALANEWSSKGVNVNAIAPGYIATDNTAALRADPVRSRQILERIPAGRWGEASDIAGACVFLCSPAADYVHGVVLPVDGGWLAR
jgi:NAD(P)-dependent dehydrogenase (short-subunit alcohol dehydrogenase family)